MNERRVRRAQIGGAVVLAVGMAAGIGAPAKAGELTHVDRAYLMAARAITLEASQHSFPPGYLANAFFYGEAVYAPGDFVGLKWLCDPLAGDGTSETCSAGLEYRPDGTKFLRTGT